MSYYVLDEDGEPRLEPDALAWGLWFETAERHVARTNITESVWVSTVFLGIDHGFSSNANVAPVLWETMVFGLPGEDEPQWRYQSRKDAEQGHETAVAYARDALGLPPP